MKMRRRIEELSEVVVRYEGILNELRKGSNEAANDLLHKIRTPSYKLSQLAIFEDIDVRFKIASRSMDGEGNMWHECLQIRLPDASTIGSPLTGMEADHQAIYGLQDTISGYIQDDIQVRSDVHQGELVIVVVPVSSLSDIDLISLTRSKGF